MHELSEAHLEQVAAGMIKAGGARARPEHKVSQHIPARAESIPQATLVPLAISPVRTPAAPASEECPGGVCKKH